ncbi:MAG: replication factor C large subunit [Candidatus Diapherotrites archaeon]|nr:replication factor C large subunit [Candidatus Diapherotrites archaeon]
MLFTEKYFPKNEREFIGNQEIVESVLKWAKLWNDGKKQIPLLFVGPSGVGKTCLAHLVAKLNNWDIFEMNASDLRDKESIERIAGAAAFNTSFSGNLRLILLDEIDGLSANDRGASSAILTLIREARNPIILTANDVYSDRKLNQIRLECKILEFRKVNYISIANHLENICRKENIEYDKEALKELASKSYGDVRSALLDLQSLSYGKKIDMQRISEVYTRDRYEKIFEVMKHIFRAKNFEEARSAINFSDVSEDLLFLWIEENIPRQYDGSDIFNAFDYVSKASLYETRIIRRQNYSLKKFYYDFLSAGVALSRTKQKSDFVPYQFPKILLYLSRISAKKEILNSIAEKIKAKTHSSKREIIAQDIPYLKQLFQNENYAIAFTKLFGFEEKEISFLLGDEKIPTDLMKVLEGREKNGEKSHAKRKIREESENKRELQTKLFNNQLEF